MQSDIQIPPLVRVMLGKFNWEPISPERQERIATIAPSYGRDPKYHSDLQPVSEMELDAFARWQKDNDLRGEIICAENYDAPLVDIATGLTGEQVPCDIFLSQQIFDLLQVREIIGANRRNGAIER